MWVDILLVLAFFATAAALVVIVVYVRKVDAYLAAGDNYEQVYDIPPPKSFEQHVRDGEGRN